VRPPRGARPTSSKSYDATMADEITLTIPRDRDFHRVAHLVLGGLASRLNLTIENLEDLQLAIDAVLDRGDGGDQVTVTMCLRGDELETTIAPVDVRSELERDVSDELGLRRVLDAVVDEVELEGDSVKLTKKVRAGG
jgi:hypothetical protein